MSKRVKTLFGAEAREEDDATLDLRSSTRTRVPIRALRRRRALADQACWGCDHNVTVGDLAREDVREIGRKLRRRRCDLPREAVRKVATEWFEKAIAGPAAARGDPVPEWPPEVVGAHFEVHIAGPRERALNELDDIDAAIQTAKGALVEVDAEGVETVVEGGAKQLEILYKIRGDLSKEEKSYAPPRPST